MAAADENVARRGEREIRFSRVFDAPRELVWEAWTDPKHIGRWWGPDGFTTTTHSMSLQPGGQWLHVLHGPDGTDYDNHVLYKEVMKPSRLVYVHGGKSHDEPRSFEVTVIFTDQGAKTRLDMTMVFKSAAARDELIREYGVFEGGKQHLERLRAHLATLHPRKIP